MVKMKSKVGTMDRFEKQDATVIICKDPGFTILYYTVLYCTVLYYTTFEKCYDRAKENNGRMSRARRPV